MFPKEAVPLPAGKAQVILVILWEISRFVRNTSLTTRRLVQIASLANPLSYPTSAPLSIRSSVNPAMSEKRCGSQTALSWTTSLSKKGKNALLMAVIFGAFLHVGFPLLELPFKEASWWIMLWSSPVATSKTASLEAVIRSTTAVIGDLPLLTIKHLMIRLLSLFR